jgi:hypothetical protein
MNIKPTYLACTVLAALLGAPAAVAGGRPLESPTFRPGLGGLAGVTRLLASSPRQLSSASWWGGTYTVPDGERISLYISTSYPQVDAVAQQWVSFFGGLPHGTELSAAKVYIAPLDEVAELCYSDEVVGCYGGQELVTVGDSGAGYAPASIAAHEYGHHIAANRSNAPWQALDWGTKRWASAMGICTRVATGMAFPGDEGANYSLNPGEGFAESYRVLAETGGAAVAYDWPIVDPSFRPTPDASAAIREDIFHPWTGPTSTTVRGKFLRRSRSWSTQLATPLDGDLRLRVTVAHGGADDVALLSGDGRTVLATGSWASTGGKYAEYRVCGARSLRVRVTRGGSAARFTLQLQVP